jgi:tRNA nucleotidyltransferase/poly(A) polymerase
LNRHRLASLLRHRTARDRLTKDVRDAARELAAEVWLVGGYVRDAALGRRATDVDLIAGRGAARLIRELQRLWSTRGFRFRKRGVTTWRFAVDDREVDVVDASRRGFEHDLRRRDFTINAVAYDFAEGTIVDPLGGLADARAHRLRLPQRNAIREDPLRALRAARFMAQYPSFTLRREAREQASRAAAGLRRAARERIRVELDKLLDAKAPARGLEVLEALGLVDAVLPELASLRTCRAGTGRPDVWRHTLDAIDRSCRPGRLPGARAIHRESGQRLLRWALLLHDISKPETYAVLEDGRPTFHGHEVLGAGRADALLERLRLPREERRRVRRLILHHLRPSHLADAGAPPRGMRRLVREAGKDLPLLVLHAGCDALASGSPDTQRRWRHLRSVLIALVELWEARRATSLPRLVDGRDVMRALGAGPGRQVGELLERIRELQEEGTLDTRDDALAWLRDLRA